MVGGKSHVNLNFTGH